MPQGDVLILVYPGASINDLLWQQFFVPRAPEERLRLTRSAAYEDLKLMVEYQVDAVIHLSISPRRPGLGSRSNRLLPQQYGELARADDRAFKGRVRHFIFSSTARSTAIPTARRCVKTMPRSRRRPMAPRS